MPRGIYDHNNRRNKKEEILKAAMRVYAFYGFEGATIERMAASAGVSKALVLKHFGTKQDLVKEMAAAAVRDNIEKLRRIDEKPNLTLPKRERLIFGILKPAREEWCLILGTLLVPNFQFQMRNEIEDYIKNEHLSVLKHKHELIKPDRDTAFILAYTLASLRMGYIVDGREQNYRKATKRLFSLYLQDEKQG